MNKRQLVEGVAKAAGIGVPAAAEAVDAVLEAVSSSLAAGQSVTVAGFGTFEVRDRSARTGRNPRTGAAIEIPASRVPAFRAGKSLREAVN